MKVLHVMSTCAKVAGVAHVVMNYYRHIHRDVTFDFLLYWDVEDSFKDEIQQLGGTIFVSGKPGVRDVPAYIRYLNRFFAEHAKEYDAVHLHEMYLSSIIFPIAKRHGIRVLISHSHSTQFSDKKLNALRNSVLFLPARFLSTHYFACSRAAGVFAFGRKKINSSKFYCLKNAVDTEKYLYSVDARAQIRKEFSMEDNLLIGHIGRFAPVKNHMFLLDVFAKIQKKVPNAKLLLAGHGPTFHDVQKKAEALDIAENVLQPGIRTDVGALLSAMDVLVLPSFSEGLPVVLVEAQTNGLPCIASATITEETKILPNYHVLSLEEDPEVWADTILACNHTRIPDAQTFVADAGYALASAAKDLYHQYCLLCNNSQGKV